MDRKIKKKKFTPKRISGVLLAGGFLAFGFYQFILGDYSVKLDVQKERISISTVRKGPFQEYIPVIGTVIPRKTIYLDAVEGGRVEKRYIEAGTFVKKGQNILTLVNTDMLLDIMNREAEFFQLNNDLRNAHLIMEQNRLDLQSKLLELDYKIKQKKRKYAREEILRKKEIIPAEQYEDTKTEYEYLCRKKELTKRTLEQDSRFRENQIKQIKASLKRMEANLNIAKQKLEDLTIKAPVTGHLTSLNAETGESKKRGERLGQIDILEGFKIRVPVDEHYIARINAGQNGEFTFDQKTNQITISKIYPEVADGRFEIDMEFDGLQPEGITRGQTLHIRLELGNLSTAVLLPQGGFYQKTGGQWIYLIDDTGEFAIKRKINIGRQNPEVFEVLAGLNPGDEVITSSYDNYGDNIDKLILK
jgi:HlyD family secretion protein